MEFNAGDKASLGDNENQMETSRITGVILIIRVDIEVLYWDNGKETGNYYNGVLQTTIMEYLGIILGGGWGL